MKVLIIETDDQIIKNMNLCLKIRYPDVITISTDKGEKGIDKIETESPDLVISSSDLPDMSIEKLATNIRTFSNVPLLTTTKSDSDYDKARILEAGVDEYVTKPINCIVFMATVNALLRRTKGISFQPNDQVVINNQLTINFGTHEVFVSDHMIHMTPTEYKLLAELVRNSGKVLTHKVLLKKVWGEDYIYDLNFLKKYIYRLRCKIESDHEKPSIILTERGLGYKVVKSY